jgi:hypothetical protein
MLNAGWGGRLPIYDPEVMFSIGNRFESGPCYTKIQYTNQWNLQLLEGEGVVGEWGGGGVVGEGWWGVSLNQIGWEPSFDIFKVLMLNRI